MGCILDERRYEEVSDTERWRFRVVLYSDPMDDPTVTAVRQVRDPGGNWHEAEDGSIYRRTFLRSDFNDRHYRNFRKKLARDERYRRRFYDGRLSST
ncbi:MAG: hypothetical protein GVY12_01025 [Bacteroidetes bacterium]|jgi:hypothetical protein|nr:hypothetical protein [Bacteroidota bacterium]